MWEDNGAAIGKDGVYEGDRWVEILPDVEIAVIERCSDNFEEKFVRLWDRKTNVIQSQSMITLGGGNGDGFWHAEEAFRRAA